MSAQRAKNSKQINSRLGKKVSDNSGLVQLSKKTISDESTSNPVSQTGDIQYQSNTCNTEQKIQYINQNSQTSHHQFKLRDRNKVVDSQQQCINKEEQQIKKQQQSIEEDKEMVDVEQIQTQSDDAKNKINCLRKKTLRPRKIKRITYVSDDDFSDKKNTISKKKRKGIIKNSQKYKKSTLNKFHQKILKNKYGKPLLDGVSIYDLIIPWKAKKIDKNQKKIQQESSSHQTSIQQFLEKSKNVNQKQVKNIIKNKLSQVNDEQENQLIQDGLAKVIKPKDQICNINLDTFANDVEVILINPNWNLNGLVKDKKGNKISEGISIEEFQKLNFSKQLMIDGLVFVWVEKQLISEVIKILEKQDMNYVENICWVMLDESKRQEVDNSGSIDVSPSYVRDQSPYLKKSKKTLLIFRRLLKKANNALELRHQRTCDVCFDFREENIKNYKPNEYIYKLIETLLPKSMVNEQKKHLRMIELWAFDQTPRKGWMKFIE